MVVGVVLMGGVVPVMGSPWISGVAPRWAASRAAPSALRFAAAASLRCACSVLRCSLVGSRDLVGRGGAPRPPPPQLVPVLVGGYSPEWYIASA